MSSRKEKATSSRNACLSRFPPSPIMRIKLPDIALPVSFRRPGFEPGTQFGNYDRLEILLPETDQETITEEEVICHLLGKPPLCSALVQHIEEFNRSSHPHLWLRHRCLGVPLLYKMGEGPRPFTVRMRRRLQASRFLKLVGWKAKSHHQLLTLIKRNLAQAIRCKNPGLSSYAPRAASIPPPSSMDMESNPFPISPNPPRVQVSEHRQTQGVH